MSGTIINNYTMKSKNSRNAIWLFFTLMFLHYLGDYLWQSGIDLSVRRFIRYVILSMLASLFVFYLGKQHIKKSKK